MNERKLVGASAIGLLMLAASVVALAQGNRGKAELKVGSGSVTVDYGRPSSKTDRVSELQIRGEVWRMGMNAATTLTTPVDLMFGNTKIGKGSYSLFLARPAADKYELVFNSKTGIWGTDHSAASDVAKIPMKKESVSSLIETFTLELKQASGGGTFVMSWGTTKLSADFKTQ